MSDAPDNLVLTLLHAIRADVTEIKVEFKADLLEIKERLGFVEGQCASLFRRLDRVAVDVDRIKVRLNLVDETIS